MRVKRLHKFRRLRWKRRLLILLIAVVTPCLSVFIGYLLTSVVILPALAEK